MAIRDGTDSAAFVRRVELGVIGDPPAVKVIPMAGSAHTIEWRDHV
jgi:hypothetical protein